MNFVGRGWSTLLDWDFELARSSNFLTWKSCCSTTGTNSRLPFFLNTTHHVILRRLPICPWLSLWEMHSRYQNWMPSVNSNVVVQLLPCDSHVTICPWLLNSLFIQAEWNVESLNASIFEWFYSAWHKLCHRCATLVRLWTIEKKFLCNSFHRQAFHSWFVSPGEMPGSRQAAKIIAEYFAASEDERQERLELPENMIYKDTSCDQDNFVSRKDEKDSSEVR